MRVIAVLVCLVACKSNDETCFEARDAAKRAWLAVAKAEGAMVQQTSHESAYVAMRSAHAEAGKLRELHGCFRANELVSRPTIGDGTAFAYVNEAP